MSMRKLSLMLAGMTLALTSGCEQKQPAAPAVETPAAAPAAPAAQGGQGGTQEQFAQEARTSITEQNASQVADQLANELERELNAQ
jgi:hypothetical protein